MLVRGAEIRFNTHACWRTLQGQRLVDAIFVSLLPAGHHLFSILIYVLFFPPVGTIFMPSLCCNLEHQYLPEGRFYMHLVSFSYVWYPAFCGYNSGDTPDCLALAASGAYAHGSSRSVTNSERVLNWLPSPGHSKRQQSRSLTMRGPLTYLHNCGLRSRLPRKHTSKCLL